MCYWTDTYIGHCLSSCFNVAQHFGNSLQNMFYRQCPMFSTCVSYITLCIFDLNFWSHLWSLTANHECTMCGVEKDNWDTMMKTVFTKWKLGGRLYAVTLIITLATFPSCSWAVQQRVWYSNVWQTVIVSLIKIFQKVCRGSFWAKGLSSYLACVICHLISQQNARCIALRQVTCDPCAVLNVSWQTD